MANSLFNQLNNQQQQNNSRATVQSIMREVQQSGMSAKDLFLIKARQQGIDPQKILSQVPIQFR